MIISTNTQLSRSSATSKRRTERGTRRKGHIADGTITPEVEHGNIRRLREYRYWGAHIWRNTKV